MASHPVCMYVCVSERVREREREIYIEREKERECVCVCVSMYETRVIHNSFYIMVIFQGVTKCNILSICTVFLFHLVSYPMYLLTIANID